jgi:hypothetical protein
VPILEGITSTIQVSLAAPLTHHLGKPLAETDPIAAARMALNYYAEMLWEAKQTFFSEELRHPEQDFNPQQRRSST